MRVLIAPDKFKGTLTAQEAAQAIARGWRRARPQDELQLLPISDGGDGFGVILGKLIGARRMSCRTMDAAHRPHRAAWWWHQPNQTAIIESAEVIGLAKLPKGEFHPFELDTFGLARLFNAAQSRGARKIIVGIGGSATNDAGFGLARGLGWEFLDQRGRTIERWTGLDNLARVLPPNSVSACNIIVAVDVRNRLLGATGATRVYGPQKGLRSADFPKAEACLQRLARVVADAKAKIPGAGAGGGLGFGLMSFLDATVVSGFELFAQQAWLNKRLGKHDLVITGEGSMDGSTRMGKGVGQLVVLCASTGIPCVGLVGTATKEARRWRALHGVVALTDYFSQAHALRQPADCLERLATRASGIFAQTGV